MQWFDAGVNLLDNRLAPRETLLEAHQAGVNRMCVITTQPKEWRLAEQLYQQYPESLCYTVGVHPHCARLVTDADFDALRIAAGKPGVVAIGECGLDFNRNFSPQDTQLKVFERQLELAAELNMPVYLHERDAFDTQLACLNNVRGELASGIAHCFTSHQQHMQAYLELGLHIGITGWICDPKRGEQLRQALPFLPIEKLILETDAPYLYPKNRKPRTSNNQPAYLPFIAQTVAEIKNLSVEQLSQHSYANTCLLFGLGQ
ncbi:TatD family deoxyribonuclease [Alteromonas aestuariivivens]|uniref:TatD family deoxyribonuclease n=1 Tax=Alteromonas aestuariivivens TaxID=1938339 RepID=A0A3D8M9K5_9ALTE|nr:TatD family hydrolase [Alteromonas aestuariivivens]RDV26656.1 TatD family deoxyribonuclease [Alteromonas aestuariivivens]